MGVGTRFSLNTANWPLLERLSVQRQPHREELMHGEMRETGLDSINDLVIKKIEANLP